MATTAAKKATMRDYNPREVVAYICDRHPSVGADEAFKIFRTLLAGKFSNYQEAVDRYCFEAQWRSIHDDRDRRTAYAAERAVPRFTVAELEVNETARRQRTKEMVEKIKQIVIMEMPSPLGKPYGDCTGAEMAKIGGWATSISRRLKPNEVVRNKLTEADLHKARGF